MKILLSCSASRSISFLYEREREREENTKSGEEFYNSNVCVWERRNEGLNNAENEELLARNMQFK